LYTRAYPSIAPTDRAAPVRFTPLEVGGIVPSVNHADRVSRAGTRRQRPRDLRNMRVLPTSIVVLGWTFAACTTDVGVPSSDAGGTDALVQKEVGASDDVSSDVSLDTDPPIDVAVIDAAVGEERRFDAVAEDVVRDASRNDGSISDAGARDAVQPDRLEVDGGALDAALVDAPMGDRSPADAGCVLENDQAFCARLGKNCETVTETDSCGALRTANCGSCAAAMGCVDRVCKTPVCSSFTYSSVVFSPFSLSGSSDFAIATSAGGESVVYAQSPGPDCATSTVYVADEITPGSRTYTSRSLTSWLDANSVAAQALTGDGLGLITLTRDFHTFQLARRSALQLLDFDAPSAIDFKAVNAMLAGTTGNLRGAVISADGLEFCFTIFGASAAMDGIYCSTRAATSSRFATGSRLIGVDASYTDVTGISSDRLALFVFKPWAGFVFTRGSTTAEFSNPNAPNAPPQLAGWQHKPLADCATVLATNAVGGGCGFEDIVFQTRR
jgi:hypothetical protein